MRRSLLCLLGACTFERGTLPAAQTPDGSGADGGGIDTSVVDAASATLDAPAVVVALKPVADTWLREQFPTETHGADTDLRTGSGSTAGRANRLLVLFDMNAIPSDCAIDDARLFLYFFQEDFNGVSPTFNAHRMTVSWSESSASWSLRNGGSPWTSAGGDFDSTVAGSTMITASSFGWSSWEITGLVAAWRSGAVPNYGLAVVEPNDNAGNNGRKEFYSAQSSAIQVDRQPYLRVTCR